MKYGLNRFSIQKRILESAENDGSPARPPAIHSLIDFASRRSTDRQTCHSAAAV
jgi:hypothetical protein